MVFGTGESVLFMEMSLMGVLIERFYFMYTYLCYSMYCPVYVLSNLSAIHSMCVQETQLKNLTELKLTTVTDYNTRSMATKQVTKSLLGIDYQ